MEYIFYPTEMGKKMKKHTLKFHVNVLNEGWHLTTHLKACVRPAGTAPQLTFPPRAVVVGTRGDNSHVVQKSLGVQGPSKGWMFNFCLSTQQSPEAF